MSFRLLALNIAGPDRQQLPAGTPLAGYLYADQPMATRAYHTGLVEENGRWLIRLDGPDPADRTGANVEVIAAPGCAPWGPKHGLLRGNEFIFDDGSLGIDLKAGTNPFD